jgi:hypothetical protein
VQINHVVNLFITIFLELGDMANQKRNVRKDRDAFLEELFRKNWGMITKISEHLKISRAAVSLWHRVPIKHLKTVSLFLKIPRNKIRPDLYD